MDAIQLELPLDLPEQRQLPDPEVMRQIRLADGRSKLIAELYRLDGREDPEHPMHGFFTGLGEEFHARAGRRIIERFLESEGDSRVEELAAILWEGQGDA